MEKAQAKGELNEEELRAIEMDVTGQVSNFHSMGHFAFLMMFNVDHAGFLAGCKTRSHSGSS